MHVIRIFHHITTTTTTTTTTTLSANSMDGFLQSLQQIFFRCVIYIFSQSVSSFLKKKKYFFPFYIFFVVLFWFVFLVRDPYYPDGKKHQRRRAKTQSIYSDITFLALPRMCSQTRLRFYPQAQTTKNDSQSSWILFRQGSFILGHLNFV